MQSYELLRACLSKTPNLSILALGDDFGTLFCQHTGILTCIGKNFPSGELKSSNFTYKSAGSSDELINALDTIAKFVPKTRYDLIYIDHDHRLKEVLAQIRAGLQLAHHRTVFIFDDAVPPDYGMTGPSPTAGWWVGEIWMLADILSTAQGCDSVAVTNVPPTGMLIARGLKAVNMSEVSNRYAELCNITTIEGIRHCIAPFEIHDPEAAFDEVLQSLSRQSDLVLTASIDSIFADRSLAMDAPRSWKRPAPEFVLDLSKKNLNTSGFYQSDRRLHGKYVDSFSNAYTTGFDGFISGGMFFSRTITRTESVARRHIADPKYSRTALFLQGDKLAVSQEKLETAEKINGTVFFGTPDEPDNWGMWLLYGVPGVKYFLENLASFDGYFTCLDSPWQRNMLNSLGVRDEYLKRHSLEKMYYCPSLTLIRHDVRDLTVSSSDQGAFQEASEKISRVCSGSFGERIYISRLGIGRRNPRYRCLVNEDELIEKLQTLGFRIVEPESLSFEQQVAAFATARVIIGPGGAGMFNSVFAKPGTQVITIESSMTWVESHFNLFTSCGLRCGIILGEQFDGDPDPYHKRWSLDIRAALSKIKEYLG